MIRNSVFILFAAGVLVSTGLALNCNQCHEGFVRSAKAIHGCSLADTDAHHTRDAACPNGTEYCLKTDGTFRVNYSYPNGEWGYGEHSGTIYDCGTPELVTFLLSGPPPSGGDSCQFSVNMHGVVPGRVYQSFGLQNATVCICKSANCNAGNTISVVMLTLIISMVLTLVLWTT
ncbi:uncharacterized protein LOC129594487 [Paramacrobiotus metropolitanus]|uniref:uncharacterized protein LOC129594487 n=1 Tax=Paramacrobiotus metropolitanus TaxID=2943436 RepID=UPI0024456690|nr:uncharacterized protein LOC129594487 [Paramacrobiotus metropolitanus]